MRGTEPNLPVQTTQKRSRVSMRQCIQLVLYVRQCIQLVTEKLRPVSEQEALLHEL